MCRRGCCPGPRMFPPGILLPQSPVRPCAHVQVLRPCACFAQCVGCHDEGPGALDGEPRAGQPDGRLAHGEGAAGIVLLSRFTCSVQRQGVASLVWSGGATRVAAGAQCYLSVPCGAPPTPSLPPTHGPSESSATPSTSVPRSRAASCTGSSGATACRPSRTPRAPRWAGVAVGRAWTPLLMPPLPRQTLPTSRPLALAGF